MNIALSAARRPKAEIHSALLALVLLAAALSLSCGPQGKTTGTNVGDLPFAKELSGDAIRILVVSDALAAPAPFADGGKRTAFLEAMSERLAQALRAKVTVFAGAFDPSDAAPAFSRADIVAGFLADSAKLRGAARLLPFFPLPGAKELGPEAAWWACAPDKPALALSVAQALFDLRADGSLAKAVDEALGEGEAARYLAAIGWDGILRAQYLGLDASQLAWIESRRDSGAGLKAAVREGGSFAYMPQPDGTVLGFDHDLAVALAKSLGLKLELSVQREVSGFFTKDGVMPPDLATGDYDYTPDLLKKVDVYANPWGVTPWRQRMMAMITIYPIRNQLAGRKGEEVTSIAQLSGKRFAVVRDSVQHKTLETFAKENGLPLSFVFAEGEDALYRFVREGKADYILDGSVVFALNSENLQDFSLSPFFSELQGVAWIVKKGDDACASILESFLEASRESGLLPALWTKTFKMDFKDYIAAMTAAEK